MLLPDEKNDWFCKNIFDVILDRVKLVRVENNPKTLQLILYGNQVF